VTSYRNEGYVLRVVGDEVEIAVEASPLVSRSRFTMPGSQLQTGIDPVARLARGVTGDALTHYEAISRVLGWVARNIEYDLDREQSQEATAVLERRSGYCTGVARLAVGLLQAVGIEAREVAGYVVGDDSESGGYHRWIEAYLPDRGWVFSDPLRSHHYVPANYLRLASEELLPDRGTEGLLIERHNSVETVDLSPLAAAGIRVRRNRDQQLAATLRVQITDFSTGMAELSGGTLRRVHALTDGQTTFVGLVPGVYQLRLLIPGQQVVEREIELAGRVRRTISLPSRLRQSDGPTQHGARGAGSRGVQTTTRGPEVPQGVRP
jgi:hypothetical protein